VGGSGSLVFNRWALDQPAGRGLANSPYLSIARSFFGNLHIALGFRYLDMQNPGQIGYITTATGDMSYQQALRNNQGGDAPASFVGKTQRVGLPNAGVSYRILPGLAVYGNFGRNYARPQGYPELMQTFLSARAAYTAAGVNMQYLYDKFGLTRADDYETGLRYESRRFYVTPSVFYNRSFPKGVLTRLAGIPVAREHANREIVSVQRLLQFLADVAARMHGCFPYLALRDGA
jgi:outer membrane receptor protein involved in Fe transport